MYANIFSLFLLAILLMAPISDSKKDFYEFTKPISKKSVKLYELVKVTMYTVDPKQTDSTPTETASGFIVDSLNPKKHRIIAVSHDLKRKMKWGQKVRIEGIGKFSGVYTVKDLMNKRWKKRIDILINPKDKALVFNKAKLYIL